MSWDVNLWRRWFGVLVLGIALGMLIAGQTILKGVLRDLSFLAYWLICFCFTGLAVVVALLDARALRKRAREQRRDLLTTTLKDIQQEARNRSRPPQPGRDGKSRQGRNSR